MPEEITCFACDNDPAHQCPRCGRPYCDEHGEEFCDACLEPASAVPSFSLYRGSLLALLVGTALAIWLLVQPPGSDASNVRALIPTPTQRPAANTTPAPGATGAPNTSAPTTVPGATTPRPTGTVTTQTPAQATATATARPAGTPAAGGNTYTVASGDTISTICAARRPNMSVTDCTDQIVRLNSLSSPNAISIGQTLTLPPG